jgi:U11/U12 small nuclear ribonucleoprotein SNRNP35
MSKKKHLVDDHFNYASDWGFYDPLMAGSIDATDDKPHDHGIIRALEANYKPNKNVKGDPNCTIFIARLSLNTSEEKLRKYFEKYGRIKTLRLVRDIVTGYSKGYAFIEYENEDYAKRAYQEAKYLVIDDKEVIVDYELERKLDGWVPRRLGGGLCGYKESGQLRFGCRYKTFGMAYELPEHLVEIKKNILEKKAKKKKKKDRSRSKERHRHKNH